MSEKKRNVDALAGVDAAKRETLNRLITGTAFVAPIVASFAMDGLTISKAQAQTGNGSGFVNFSDRRLKTGIARIATLASGLGLLSVQVPLGRRGICGRDGAGGARRDAACGCHRGGWLHACRLSNAGTGDAALRFMGRTRSQILSSLRCLSGRLAKELTAPTIRQSRTALRKKLGTNDALRNYWTHSANTGAASNSD